MNQQEYYFEAVQAWKNINKYGKHFAECCYHVEDKNSLAVDCGCSVRTIQYYAAAWSLYQEMVYEFQNETVSLMWEQGEIQLWRKAPELRKQLGLSLEQTKEYLATAISENMTRESFSAHVDEKENKIPKWIRRLQDIARKLRPMKYDWKTEIPVTYRAEFEQATEQYAAVLEKIANAGMEES